MTVQASGTASDPVIGYPTTFNPSGGAFLPRYTTIGSRINTWARPLAGERALGIIATGQSTIANWGTGALYTSSNPKSLQGNFYDGQAYPIQDPNFCADGTLSSPASAIGDILIGNGVYDKVMVVNCAFGSTLSSEWAQKNGNLFTGFRCCFNFLVNNGYTDIVHIHQQGEADANAHTPYATMLANLRAIDTNKASFGMQCPMYVSQTTYSFDWDLTDPSPDNWTPGPFAQAIRQAQADCVNGTSIFAGPDTDSLRAVAYRGTNVHWSTQAGIIACANLWAGVLS